MLYINPLTLEAQMFLSSLQTQKCNQIDPTLCTTLESIVGAIEKFLAQNPIQVVATDAVKLITNSELNIIQRVYHCASCKIDIGKSADKAAAHLADEHRVKTRKEVRIEKKIKEKEKRSKAVVVLPKKAQALVVNDLNKFFNENLLIAEKLKTLPEYEHVEQELRELITPLFPDHSIKMYMFGSRLSGIGTRNSDLDIFLDIGNTFNTFEHRASAQTLKHLGLVHDALKKHGKAWPQVTSIEAARVPILKVRNARTKLECDLGFSNSLGYCNTKLMEYFFTLQPIARRMCLFLKKWLERAKLYDKLSTYSISLLVICFLQLRRDLPSVERLQLDLKSDAQFVGPWIANFREKTNAELNIPQVDVNNSQICKKYLHEFFELYTNFQYEKSVVCPYFGQIVDIKTIEAAMPERYSEFVKTAVGVKDISLQVTKYMIVQDPIQLNHNVTKGVTGTLLKLIAEYFRQTAVALAALK